MWVERLSKLLSVKSILTIVLAIGYLFLAFTGKVDVSDYQTIFLMIITFYFTRRTDTNEIEMPRDKEI